MILPLHIDSLTYLLLINNQTIVYYDYMIDMSEESPVGLIFL